MVTQGTQVSTLDDEDVKSEELILNISIVDIMDNLERSAPNSYVEVMDFIQKVCGIELQCVSRVQLPLNYMFHFEFSKIMNNHYIAS